MRPFRLVFLDSKGHAQAYCTVVCGGPDGAVREARAVRYSGEIEIWDGDTLVVRLKPETYSTKRA
jgi:hypothetical protein